MSVTFEAAFIFVACWLLAQVEIQIEGPRGWAEALPTWRYQPAWLMRLTNGKPLTGYHFYLISFLIAIFHLPAVLTPWSIELEGKIVSAYLLTAVMWDFQWFVWNPAWGVKRFFKEKVWWFPKRLAGFPVEYFVGVTASLAATAWLNPAQLTRWATVVVLVVAASALAAGASLWLKPRA